MANNEAKRALGSGPLQIERIDAMSDKSHELRGFRGFVFAVGISIGVVGAFVLVVILLVWFFEALGALAK
jgi:hypothetical protein